MINDILDYGRLEKKQLKIVISRFKLSDIVNEILSLL